MVVVGGQGRQVSKCACCVYSPGPLRGKQKCSPAFRQPARQEAQEKAFRVVLCIMLDWSVTVLVVQVTGDVDGWD